MFSYLNQCRISKIEKISDGTDPPPKNVIFFGGGLELQMKRISAMSRAVKHFVSDSREKTTFFKMNPCIKYQFLEKLDMIQTSLPWQLFTQKWEIETQVSLRNQLQLQDMKKFVQSMYECRKTFHEIREEDSFYFFNFFQNFLARF